MSDVKKRSIFEFFDGNKKRREDADKITFVMQSKLNQDLTNALAAMDYNPLLPKDGETEEEAKLREGINIMNASYAGECALKVCAVTRDIFKIDEYSFDGEKDCGLTDGEVLNVFYEFALFTDAQKKTLDSKQSLPQSSEPQPSV